MITLSIATCTVHLEIKDSALAFFDHEAFCQRAATYIEPADASTQSSWTLSIEYTPGALLPGEFPTTENLFHEEQPDHSLVVSDISYCTTYWHTQRCEVVHFGDPQYVNRNLLEHVKLLVSMLIIDKGGLPMHASAIYKNQSAILFMGPSGAGKSTAAKFCRPEWTIINDEFNIIAPDGQGGWMVHATPFSLWEMQPHAKTKISIDRLFWLKKNITTRCEPLTGKDKFNGILRTVFTVPASATLGDSILANSEDLIRRVSFETLLFAKEQGFIEHVFPYHPIEI